MDCGMRCVKYLVFIFNLLFALSGLVILVVGAVVEAGYKEYLQFVPHEIFSAPIILIVVGVIIFVIAFFGCCGAMKENNCMVLTFAVLLTIVFILEISAGIAAYVLRSEVENGIEERMRSSLDDYSYDAGSGNVVTNSWNVMQYELHCCGVDSYADWQNHTSFPTNQYPKTCCPGMDESDQTVKCTQGTAGFQKEGCLAKLTNVIKDNISIIGGVGIGVAFIQLIGIIFACCLSRSIRSEYETV